jgi:hypothetical protein
MYRFTIHGLCSKQPKDLNTGFFWQFIPIVGWFITLGIFIEWVKVFAKFSFLEHTLTALVPFAYFPYVGTNKDDRFVGATVVKAHKKSATTRMDRRRYFCGSSGHPYTYFCF